MKVQSHKTNNKLQNLRFRHSRREKKAYEIVIELLHNLIGSFVIHLCGKSTNIEQTKKKTTLKKEGTSERTNKKISDVAYVTSCDLPAFQLKHSDQFRDIIRFICNPLIISSSITKKKN